MGLIYLYNLHPETTNQSEKSVLIAKTPNLEKNFRTSSHKIE